MNTIKPITILIADDHYVVRMGLKAVLQLDKSLEVIAEATTADEAVAAHQANCPDVTLLDLRMPGNGLDALLRIRKLSAIAKILILTTSELEQDIHQAVSDGANGYLSKSAVPEELSDAIRAVHAGNKWIPSHIARKLAERASNPELSQRELEVVRLIIKGLSNQDIATVLNISHSTAKAHVAHILQKLNVTTRAEAATEALRRGVVHVDE